MQKLFKKKYPKKIFDYAPKNYFCKMYVKALKMGLRKFSHQIKSETKASKEIYFFFLKLTESTKEQSCNEIFVFFSCNDDDKTKWIAPFIWKYVYCTCTEYSISTPFCLLYILRRIIIVCRHYERRNIFLHRHLLTFSFAPFNSAVSMKLTIVAL